MPGPSVQRTIVKSPPEIWSEVSDATSLARHLDGFGEITITELTPETAVAWEGDRVRGTVTLERSGWGTKVTVTAEADEGAAEPEASAEITESEPSPSPESEPEAASRVEFLPTGGSPSPLDEIRPRWWHRFRRKAARAPEGAPEEPPPAHEPIVVVDVEPEVIAAIEPEPEPLPELEPILNAMLDHLSAAHHRPFSRG